MSLDVELAVFGRQVPFLAERHYTKLPQITDGNIPKSIEDTWTILALLIEEHNDRTIRCVLRHNCRYKNSHNIAIVRVGIYNGGYTRDEWTRDHDFPLKDDVVDELFHSGYLAGTPHSGWTDNTELYITQRGKRALVDHINSLVHDPA